ALSSARSGVSKKKTWRICASSGSMPSASTVARWCSSGIVSFSSTESASLIRSIRRPSSSSGIVIAAGIDSSFVSSPSGFHKSPETASPTGGDAGAAQPPGCPTTRRSRCDALVLCAGVGEAAPVQSGAEWLQAALRCPRCLGTLEIGADLHCVACGSQYARVDGTPVLIDPNVTLIDPPVSVSVSNETRSALGSRLNALLPALGTSRG